MSSEQTNQWKLCLVNTYIPPSFSGAGRRVYRYAQRLHRKGALGCIVAHRHRRLNRQDLLLFSSEASSDPIPPHKRLLVPSGIHDIWNTLGRIHYFLYYSAIVVAHLLLLFLRRRRSFDIAHCFGTDWFSLYALGIAKLCRKRTVLELTILGSDDPLCLSKHRHGLRYRIKRWLFDKADIVIGISPALMDGYLSSGMPKHKLRLVPNPVDVELYSPSSKEEKDALRSKLGFSDSFPVILHVGAIIKRKGVDLLAKAFPKIASHYPKARLVLVGPYLDVSDKIRLAPTVKRMAEEAGLEDRLVFTGQVSNVEEYMKASDVLVLASREEGCPNVVIEAMATGLPVIVSRLPGITDYIIDDAKDGLVVEQENPDELAAAVVRVLQDETLYKSISRRARETAVTRFATEVIDKQYEDTYNELAR